VLSSVIAPVVAEHVALLANGTVHDLATATFTPPSIIWDPSAGLQNIARKVAWVAAFIWLFTFLSMFFLPKRRNMMMGGQISAGRFVGAATLILLLMDLNLVPTVVNGMLQGIWWAFSLVGLT